MKYQKPNSGGKPVAYFSKSGTGPKYTAKKPNNKKNSYAQEPTNRKNEQTTYYKTKNSQPPTQYDYAPKPKKKHKIFKTLLTFAAVFVVLIFGFIWLKLAKINYVTPEEVTQDMGITLDTRIETYENMATNSLKIADGEIKTDPKVINILLIGTDERTDEYSTSARSDSMMILSINKRNNSWKLVSFERATGVLIPNRAPDWLTHTFNYGGPELLLATIRNHYKIDVTRYARVNFTAFTKAIDAIGGVDIEISAEEADYLQNRCGGIHSAGIDHLDGEFALHYARMRQIDSDWKRVERQRKVIGAMVEKAKHTNVFALNRAVDEVLPLVQTNLTKGEMFSIILHVPFLMNKPIQQMTAPAQGTFTAIMGADGRSMYAPDYNANKKILEDLFYNS